MIIETLTKSQFSDAFYKSGRGEQFSYEARNLIYDYLDELENYELDVIGICCEFAEYENLEEFQNDYGEEYNSINGNPKYRFHTDDGVVTTPSDAMFVYGLNVDSFYNKDVVIDYHLTTKGKAILDNITLKAEG